MFPNDCCDIWGPTMVQSLACNSPDTGSSQDGFCTSYILTSEARRDDRRFALKTSPHSASHSGPRQALQKLGPKAARNSAAKQVHMVAARETGGSKAGVRHMSILSWHWKKESAGLWTMTELS